MTVPEVCEFLRIPYQTFMHRRCQGKLGFKSWRDGTKVYVATEDLANYIEARRKILSPTISAKLHYLAIWVKRIKS
ncbi:helix-turn-helix domain-containing protein [Polynucleobacter sp. AP-Mumm-500A-B3]|nr:helix-turn-helix domain-containing protein [Polynucleobacter nymphae]